MRGRRGLVVVALVVAACGSGDGPTTTAVAPSTTAVGSTSTVASTTPTSTVVEATTTTVAAVEGVPEEALALIGAPMPEVPEYPDGFDAEVWFEAYAAWNQWAFANPVEGLESLELWVVPGSEHGESLREQLEREVAEGWRIVRDQVSELRSAEVAEEFEAEGFIEVNGEVESLGTGWLLSGDSIVGVEDFAASGPSRLIIALEEVGGAWLVSAWGS